MSAPRPNSRLMSLWLRTAYGSQQNLAETPEGIRLALLRVALLCNLLVSSGLSGHNLLHGRLLIGSITTLMALTSPLIGIYLHRSGNIKTAARIFTTLAFAFFLGLNCLPVDSSSLLFWSFLFPLLASQLLDYPASQWTTVAFFAANLVLLVGMESWLGSEVHGIPVIVRFLIVLAVVSAITWTIDRSRAMFQNRLQQELDLRKAFENKLIHSKRELEKALNVRNEIMANISHEMRTPLNGIVGLAELLRGSNLSDDQLQYANSLYGTAQLLGRLIEDILILSRAEGGKMSFEPRPVNLSLLAAELVDTHRASAESKGLDINLHLDENLPGWVLADSVRLGQVLSNLLDNAIKFTDVGHVLLSLNAIRKDQLDKIRITVSDTGIGIAPDHHQRVFEKFQQAGNAVGRAGSGLGLGLAIAKHLVELMKGQIMLESQEGAGSTFQVTLDLPEISSPGAEAPAEIAEPSRDICPVALQGRVLLVEDNDVNRLVASTMLKSMGCELDVAENGQAALDLWAPGRYDLILMDCRMPVMDGFTTAKHIRDRESSNDEHTPIAALTAYSNDQEQERCQTAGMDDFLAKPYTFDDLTKLVQRWLTRESSAD